MLSESSLMGFSSIDNKDRHCDNTPVFIFESNKNEPQMDPAKNGDIDNSNNINNVTNNNIIKRENLSPPTNGDVQSSISRSRSVTPLSFRDTPPQTVHPNDVTGLGLSINTRSGDFRTVNYSDFMRSLAAKYNNSNSNDNVNQRETSFTSKLLNSSNSNNKDSPSPPEEKRNHIRSRISQSGNTSLVSSIFSNLPFTSTVFPPLIDMSSTQALLTLARAAKEAEIQNILKTAQKRPLITNSSISSVRSNLTTSPQQNIQYQIQKSFSLGSTNLHTSLDSLNNEQTKNPCQINEGLGISPLDLSSAQQPKRLKTESYSRPGSTSSLDAGQSNSSLKENKSAENVCTTVLTHPSRNINRYCQAQSEQINSWTIDEVCQFVGNIDLCAEYAKNFRDQCIDGAGLPLLTEDHLIRSLGMKLGPALKLKSVLAKKLGGPCPCASCATIQTHLNLPNVSGTRIIQTPTPGYSIGSNCNANTSTIHSSLVSIPRPASTESGS